MKRFLSLCLLLMLLAPSAVADAFDLTSMPDSELLALREQIDTELSRRHADSSDEIVVMDDSHGKLIYKSHKIETLGRDTCVVVEFEFVNTTSHVEHFNPYIWIDLFQDGIELESTWSYHNYEASTPNIRSGYSYTVYLVRVLRNQTSPIELEYSSFSHVFNMTLPKQ